MSTALPAVELFSTSILSNHAVRKKHERYTSVLSIRKIPYVYHDMASDEEAKKRWRAKARDQTIPGLLVHNEWRGTFAEFDEAVEFEELDLFLAIDHERLKREQALLAGNSSNGDGAATDDKAADADPSVPSAESASNGAPNGKAGEAPSSKTTAKYTGEAPPPFAPEGSGKRRSLDADDFLKALGIDESSLNVDDAELADMLNDASLRSSNQATVESLRAGAASAGGSSSKEAEVAPLNGLKGNAALGIGAAAAVRNAERKAQRAVLDEEKLKLDGLGPLAEGAPVELFTTSLLSNTGVRERHERFMQVLTSNQIHFRRYDLISDEVAKKRWRAKSRDPQLPGVLVHGEWRGSYADFDTAARQGPDALSQWLNIDARLANASVTAAREASTNPPAEAEEDADGADAPLKSNNRFSLAIDDFLASLGVADLKLGDADVDELLNGSGIPVVPGGEGAPIPPLRAAIPLQEREVIKEEEEPEAEVEAPVEIEKVEEEAEIPKEEVVEEGTAEKSAEAAEEELAEIPDVDDSVEEKKESPEEPETKEEEPETVDGKVEEPGSAAEPVQEAVSEGEKVVAIVEEEPKPESDAPVSPEVAPAEDAVATVKDDTEEKDEPSVPKESEPAEADEQNTNVVGEAPDTEPAASEDKANEVETEAAAAVEAEADTEAESPPPPPEKESEPSSAVPTAETTPVTSPGNTVRKPRKSKSRNAVPDLMEEGEDDVSPGRRGMDYQRPANFAMPSPSPSMPFLTATSPTSPDHSGNGKNGAGSMSRSASSMSGFSQSKDGTSSRNRSGSGSAKRGLGSRLSNMKFGKDKDKDRDKVSASTSMGTIAAGSGWDESEGGGGGGGGGGVLSSPLRSVLSRDGSSGGGGGLFKSRSRSPGPSSSKFKAKDRDVRGGAGGNAPPVPAIPRLVSSSVRAERTLSQILRDADEAMRTADAQMKSDDEGGGGNGLEGAGAKEDEEDEDGEEGSEDEGGASRAPDPFGKDQVTVRARG
ncbi:hypothetical protein A4X13_0g2389 [Tilletia indica]|uniref:Glutaredoxin domain-containing protein n=1 Tax=Tilletia indica TaxID=43049 RepID=A0A177TQJ2_9BASI|nr:hypothetical protein A4X13_0g2389 [Tilletia indica]